MLVTEAAKKHEVEQASPSAGDASRNLDDHACVDARRFLGKREAGAGETYVQSF